MEVERGSLIMATISKKCYSYDYLVTGFQFVSSNSVFNHTCN